jgi:hypothetical protein
MFILMILFYFCLFPAQLRHANWFCLWHLGTDRVEKALHLLMYSLVAAETCSFAELLPSNGCHIVAYFVVVAQQRVYMSQYIYIYSAIHIQQVNTFLMHINTVGRKLCLSFRDKRTGQSKLVLGNSLLTVGRFRVCYKAHGWLLNIQVWKGMKSVSFVTVMKPGNLTDNVYRIYDMFHSLYYFCPKFFSFR